MTLAAADLSRAVSHALRHKPWLYELELDGEGWAPVEQLLSALREKGGDWQTVDRDALDRMLSATTKRRHELSGGRIRALYGHSLPGRIERVPASPPAELFHGTSLGAAEEIGLEGLRPMGRQYVHLSVDRATARAVGARKGGEPVVLVVAARAAAEDGVVFYIGNERVWLADRVPARFVTLASDSGRVARR